MIIWYYDLRKNYGECLVKKYIDSYRVFCGEIECLMYDKNFEK